MKIKILYGENDTGKSSFLRSIKNNKFVIAPNFVYTDVAQGETYANSFVRFIDSKKYEYNSLGFENFDSFISKNVFFEFFKNLYSMYKDFNLELILETRYGFALSALGMLIQDGLIPKDNASVIFFYTNEEPMEKFFGEDGFIKHE